MWHLLTIFTDRQLLMYFHGCSFACKFDRLLKFYRDVYVEPWWSCRVLCNARRSKGKIFSSSDKLQAFYDSTIQASVRRLPIYLKFVRLRWEFNALISTLLKTDANCTHYIGFLRSRLVLERSAALLYQRESFEGRLE